MEGTVFDIQRFCVHDGPGIRTTVFMKGCPLRCVWCHNPEGLKKDIQVQYFKDKCIGCLRCNGERNEKAAEKCPAEALKICGKRMTCEQLLEEVLRDRDFYVSDGGVTFSGGECLLQADFVSEMLKLIKNEGINTAVDTCGNVKSEELLKTAENCDLYLYDVKCASPMLHKKFTGADNVMILKNLRLLSDIGKKLWIRIPVIPDYNDNAEEMEKIARILGELKTVTAVTLMPYHTLGKSKYETLGISPPYNTDKIVTKQSIDFYKKIFSKYNLPIE